MRFALFSLAESFVLSGVPHASVMLSIFEVHLGLLLRNKVRREGALTQVLEYRLFSQLHLSLLLLLGPTLGHQYQI